MTLWVKLCGIRTLRDLEGAVEAGADAVGIVMTPSPRRVDINTARSIVESAKGSVETVGVFHFPERLVVEKARDVVGFDLYQAEPESLSGIEGIVTLPVVHDGPAVHEGFSDSLRASGSGRVLVESAGKGGQGIPPDFDRVSRIPTLGRAVLAGGLNVENVAGIVKRLAPGGVDVSTGIESEQGTKDRLLMTRFVSAARTSEGDENG